MNRKTRINVALTVLLLLAAPLGAQVMAWTRWETALTTTTAFSYNNPYRNVLLQVTWTCVSDCNGADPRAKMTTYGYWDGGRTFRIRAAFPQPLSTATATWQWQTSCSRPAGSSDTNCANDPNLHGRSGTVTVSRSDSSPNALYRGGALRMAELNNGETGNVHFANDLGPFYWQGDTAWNAPIRATFVRGAAADCTTATGFGANEWKCYVADRVAKNFTAVQISVPQGGMADPLEDRGGNTPFIGMSNWNSWNPPFWRGFEDKVQWANENGLVVLVVGLMEPAYSNSSPRYPTAESDSVLFARNLAARLGGNHVIFSPGFDTRPDTASKRSRIRAVGNVIHAVSPRPIITNHFGGQTEVGFVDFVYNDYADFNGEAWLDTNLFQSGQARTLRDDPAAPTPQLQQVTLRARQMPRDLRALSPRKGSANIESIYDYAGLTAPALPVYHSNYSPYRVRHTAYLSALSGAFGYSMGVAGIYDWGLGVGTPYSPRTPRNSINSASANEIRLLGNLFRAHRWEWFAPADFILNNPTGANTQHLQMVLSRDVTRRSTLAYLPDNATIQLSLSTTLYPDLAGTRWLKRFFNPKTGAYTGNVTPGGSAPNFTFTRPACPVSPCNSQNGDNDWVLELLDTTAGARLVGEGPSLHAFARFDETTQNWSINGQLVNADGTPAGDAFAISEATSEVQRLPLITRANGGEFVVVWEADTGILARRVSANGAVIGAVQRVNETTAGRQHDPVLTSDASGAVVIAWTDGPTENMSRIVARRFSSELAPLGPELVLSSSRAASRRSPLITADAAGNFAVAWEEHDPITNASSIITRRVSAAGAIE